MEGGKRNINLAALGRRVLGRQTRGWRFYAAIAGVLGGLVYAFAAAAPETAQRAGTSLTGIVGNAFGALDAGSDAFFTILAKGCLDVPGPTWEELRNPGAGFAQPWRFSCAQYRDTDVWGRERFRDPAPQSVLGQALLIPKATRAALTTIWDRSLLASAFVALLVLFGGVLIAEGGTVGALFALLVLPVLAAGSIWLASEMFALLLRAAGSAWAGAVFSFFAWLTGTGLVKGSLAFVGGFGTTYGAAEKAARWSPRLKRWTARGRIGGG